VSKQQASNNNTYKYILVVLGSWSMHRNYRVYSTGITVYTPPVFLLSML